MGTHLDPSLLQMFVAEVEMHMAALNEGVLALEQNPDQSDRFEDLMRAAHSIKGAAKLVGLPDAVEISHVIEDCFVAARDGRVAMTSALADVLLEGVDILGRAAQFDVPEEMRVTRQQIDSTLARIKHASSDSHEAPPPPVAPPSKPEAHERTVQLRFPAHLNAGWVSDHHREVATSITAGGSCDLDFVDVIDVDPIGLACVDSIVRLAEKAPCQLRIRNLPARLDSLMRAVGVPSSLLDSRPGD